jgi:hypothetical protein
MEYKTMKKVYMKPTVNVVKIQQQCQILAGSVRSLNSEEFNWVNGGIDGDDV